MAEVWGTPITLLHLCLVYVPYIACCWLPQRETKVKSTLNLVLPIILMVRGPGLGSATQAGTEAVSCRDVCWRWGLCAYPGSGTVLGRLEVPSKGPDVGQSGNFHATYLSFEG